MKNLVFKSSSSRLPDVAKIYDRERESPDVEILHVLDRIGNHFVTAPLANKTLSSSVVLQVFCTLYRLSDRIGDFNIFVGGKDWDQQNACPAKEPQVLNHSVDISFMVE
eukprot:764163-Hanusia_phi.AAC.7